ncbi:autotransporter assembly complex protein TamA [Salinisphaera hydrothermalis]|uniref:Translocation and assembly module subunit TamA n=1 Tax=Salinisphaera hydrothermalis (strain C41B8) TaxID=1304275 RepID=A0A084ILZ2_SALHC|nr:autotransporter assembly complex family protein [Salinisphaera hydrothermalis]KEZ77726.1 Outer membrane protein [Salinisphaera hydrothermalis C41B8]
MKYVRPRGYTTTAVVGLAAAGMVALVLIPRALADDVDVQIKGIGNPLESNVRKSLSVAGDHKQPWSPDQIQRLFRLAPKEIKQALQPYGYFNPEINERLKQPSGNSKTWHARFNIKHGPATKITRLNIDVEGPGDQLEAIQSALHSTELKKGKRLVESQYSDTKSALYNAAYNAGYLDAKFSKSAIRVNPKTNTAEIDLVLDTGERYYFGPVTFDQDLLNDKFVHRYVPFTPGQPYDAEQLINLQLALSDTDYFSQIEINAPRDKATRAPAMNQWFYDLIYPPQDPLQSIGELRIPVTVKAKPSKGQSYKISAGYGTDTGPRLGLGVKFRHLNQYGHQFRTDLRISQIQRTLQSSYDIPIGDVTQDKLSFTATISNQDFGDITSTLYGVGVTRDTGWQLGRQRAYIKLEREYYNLGYGSRNSTLLYPGYNITLQKADNLLFTHKGVSLSLDVRGASDKLLSSTNFIEGDFSAHAVVPVTAKTRIVMRTELGAIETDNFNEVPPSQRFFAGGDRSVRGYAYQSISPTNSKNQDVGGRYLATGSVEGDWFFYKKFGVAAFFDAGDVTDSLGNFSFKRGVGIGFRWGSPVGMVRLDLAHPLDDSSTPVRIHFSLGPDL